MSKINGFEEAKLLLQNLAGSHRDRLLETISQKDPSLAERLKKAMVTFEDLKYLTPEMMRVLLKEVSTEKLGLALRVASKELVEHLLKMVSQNNEKDINAVLKGKPQSVNKVQEAQDQIMDIVREKMKTGEIVIDKAGSETFV